MYDEHFNVLGLMSGTSLDGMDAALVQFSERDASDWTLLFAETYPYPPALKSQAERCFERPDDVAALADFDRDFALWTVEVIQKVQRMAAERGWRVDAVGSHGQTVFHQPSRKWTFQAGCRRELAENTGLVVVTDFRTQDVLLGGQGAPLVPFGDHLLFGSYEACVNLGGFANITWGSPTLADGIHAAFDICPVGTVLNPLAEALGMAFDADGAIARAGEVDARALAALGALDFYRMAPPKSLGSEWVKEAVWPILQGLPAKVALATATVHAAKQVSAAVGKRRTLLTGGGARNGYLVELIREYGGKIEVPTADLVDFKEAIVFALLARERLKGRKNVFGHTTGSGIDHSSGRIFHP